MGYIKKKREDSYNFLNASWFQVNIKNCMISLHFYFWLSLNKTHHKLDFYFLLHQRSSRKSLSSSWPDRMMSPPYHTNPAGGSVAPGRRDEFPDWAGHKGRPARIGEEGDTNKICRVIWMEKDCSANNGGFK